MARAIQDDQEPAGFNPNLRVAPPVGQSVGQMDPRIMANRRQDIVAEERDGPAGIP